MEQNQIQEEFKKLGISENDLPEYRDPYTFTKQIKKCSLYQVDHIMYANSTVPPERIHIAKLE
ncbi:MAG: hypothetical protein Q8O92_16085 [Candidatus Latescibacter sp.]|nr:hypothetical protein [Candidatus Latescibacter sp.]